MYFGAVLYTSLNTFEITFSTFWLFFSIDSLITFFPTDDDNRVILKTVDIYQSDYINASFVGVSFLLLETGVLLLTIPFVISTQGYSVQRKYIATQGMHILPSETTYGGGNTALTFLDPLPETVVDFWRMLWQEKTPSIVMIANLEEEGTSMRYRYWPDSGTENFGPFEVSITEQQILENYTIRRLTLQVYETQDWVEGK